MTDYPKLREYREHAARGNFVDRTWPDVGRTVDMVEEDKADAALAEQEQRAERAEALNARWNQATSRMTCGGSEFINDPETTARYVEGRRRTTQDQLLKATKGAKDLKAALAAKDAEIAERDSLGSRVADCAYAVVELLEGVGLPEQTRDEIHALYEAASAWDDARDARAGEGT